MDWNSLSVREQLEVVSRDPRLQSDPELQEWFRAANALTEANPLLTFEPHKAREGHRPQLDFIEAPTKIVAALAGNQFGKSTILTACMLREVLPRDMLPPLLQRTKRYDPPVDAWILVPTEDKIFDSFQPAFEEFCPKAAFKGGNWGKAFNGARMLLSFKNGSTIAFKTYKQDPSTLGGARLHVVGYDEPPPRKHREESRMRLVRYGGYEMFAMTPLDTNTGYIRREIWKKREADHVTVVRGSIHDNPHLDAETVRLTLGDLSDVWRQAREFGDFVDMGGLIYPDFERCVTPFDLSPDFIRGLDVIVGIDPGIRNAGLVWVGFDNENVAYVFAAELLQDQTPKGYATKIREVNERWGLRNVQYVADPAARSRGQTNSETVLTALSLEGIYANAGQNDVQAGIGQLRTRMAYSRFLVSPERTPGLLGLRDEADEYAGKEPDENRDDSHMEPVKSNDHRLDALRYACMERFWDPIMEQDAPDRTLGYKPDFAPDSSSFNSQGPRQFGPMGQFA